MLKKNINLKITNTANIELLGSKLKSLSDNYLTGQIWTDENIIYINFTKVVFIHSQTSQTTHKTQ